MFRLVASLRRTSFSSRLYHSTTALNQVLSSSPKISTPWRIIESSAGGVERYFVNKKTGESTWYTPEGMSAAEILTVPGARKYWNNIEGVEKYIKRMKEEKAKNGGKDIGDS